MGREKEGRGKHERMGAKGGKGKEWDLHILSRGSRVSRYATGQIAAFTLTGVGLQCLSMGTGETFVILATSYRPVSTAVHGGKYISDNKRKSYARPRWWWPGGATVTNMTYPVLTYRQLVIAAEPLATLVSIAN